MSDLVFAYNIITGEETPRPVPKSWIGHPVLGAHLALTPPTIEEADEPAEDFPEEE